MIYSFSNVLKVKDVQTLISATIFRQASTTMCFLYKIKGEVPLTERTYDFYVFGGALSFCFIALFSDRIYTRRKKYLPLQVIVSVSILYHLACFFLSIFIAPYDNIY